MFWRRKKTPSEYVAELFQQPPIPLPPPEKRPACVLYVGEVSLIIKSIADIVKGPVNSRVVAMIYDTLNHSVIVPPMPWPQIPHKFDSMIVIPSTGSDGVHLYVPAFVFYPV